jgi:hypothetical protein
MNKKRNVRIVVTIPMDEDKAGKLVTGVNMPSPARQKPMAATTVSLLHSVLAGLHKTMTENVNVAESIREVMSWLTILGMEIENEGSITAHVVDPTAENPNRIQIHIAE